MPLIRLSPLSCMTVKRCYFSSMTPAAPSSGFSWIYMTMCTQKLLEPKVSPWSFTRRDSLALGIAKAAAPQVTLETPVAPFVANLPPKNLLLVRPRRALEDATKDDRQVPSLKPPTVTAKDCDAMAAISSSYRSCRALGVGQFGLYVCSPPNKKASAWVWRHRQL